MPYILIRGVWNLTISNFDSISDLLWFCLRAEHLKLQQILNVEAMPLSKVRQVN